MKTALTLLAGAVAWVVLSWALTPRTEPDTALLDALRDSVAASQAQATRDSVRLAAVDDSLRAARESAEAVARDARRIASAARQRATTAEAGLRATLDSLGASTAALDSLVDAHAAEVAAMADEIAARDAERAVLYRRVEASDTVIAGLREVVARWAAVDAERARIEDRLRREVRGAQIRERVAEGVAVGALVWKALG
jgi:hypothetical protein